MKSLPANIILRKNKLHDEYPFVLMMVLTLVDGTVFRFVRNTEDVTYSGDVYGKFWFEIDADRQELQGEIPTLTLRVANVTRYLQPYIEAASGAIGASVKLFPVNTNLLAEDYTSLEMEYEVVDCSSTEMDIEFTLGAPNPLRKRFPLERYFNGSCAWKFNGAGVVGAECSYTGKTITAATKANPCVLTVTAHGYTTGDSIYIDDIVDDGPDGDFEAALNEQTVSIIVIDADSFSVGIDTSVLTNTYSSGGTAGHSTCNRTLENCIERDNLANIGCYPGLDERNAKIA